MNKKFLFGYAFGGILAGSIPYIFFGLNPAISLALFAGVKLPRITALISILLYVVISYLSCSLTNGHFNFSYWPLFTVSGYLIITLLANLTHKIPNHAKLVTYILASTIGYWLWTNFGWWLTTSFYPKDFSGLAACYVAALPFLRNAIFGNLFWGIIIFGLFLFYKLMQKNKLQSEN